MRTVLRSRRRTGALALWLVVGASACGHLGIDLGDGGVDGAIDGGLAGSTSLGTGGTDQTGPSSGGVTSTGGKDAGSGGGAAGAGGADTGGQSSGGGGGGAGSGGTGSGGTGSGGASSGGGGSGGASGGAGSGGNPGSGGTSSGGAGSGGEGAGGSGAGGSGGAAYDCDVADELCAELELALTHRYAFDSIGTEILDSLGGSSGQVFGTTLDGSGAITFSSEAEYATLPPGLLAATGSASIEAWFVWDGGEQWQKVFEFGAQNMMGNPTSYIYVSPEGGGSIVIEHALAAGIRLQAGGDRQLRTTNVTTLGAVTHVVLVADSVANRLTLYKNGQAVGQRDTEVDLGLIQDTTNRLGRSLFPDDPGFIGSILELRVYADVLSAEAIAKSYAVGPDATFGP